jgi:hypothetical protein
MPPSSSTNKEPVQAGARHFRRLLQCVSVAYFVLLGAVCMHQYSRYAAIAVGAQGTGIYRGMQEWATLTYYAFWLAISFLALSAFWQRTVWLSFYACLALFAETAAYVFFFASHLHLYSPIPAILYERFEPHPFVVALPRPGVFGPATHDADHRRVTVNEGKVARPKLIYAFGGSTTYGSDGDAETWPSQLSRLLGPQFAVQNFGMLGFSSLENMMQSLFAFRDTAPVCAVYYEGWNDLKNSHVQGLANDYSNFEYPTLVESLQLGPRPSFLQRNSLLVSSILSMFEPAPLPRAGGTMFDSQDLRLSKIYRENIKLIAVIGKTFNVRVVFIPQILNYSIMQGDSTSNGEPFIRAKDMRKLMALMNQDLASAAAESQAYFLGVPLSENWQPDDFHDPGHFSPKGAVQFASSIVEDLRRICQ